MKKHSLIIESDEAENNEQQPKVGYKKQRIMSSSSSDVSSPIESASSNFIVEDDEELEPQVIKKKKTIVSKHNQSSALENDVVLVKQTTRRRNSSNSSIGNVSDGELNDLIGTTASHSNKHKAIISSDEEEADFVDYGESRRVLMPLQYRFVSNIEWFILYCQYLYTNDDSTEEAVEAKKRYELKMNHLLEQLQSARWDPELARTLKNSKIFKSYTIESVEGCDVCRLTSRTSTSEIQLDNNTLYCGRFCLERCRFYHKVAHMIETLIDQLQGGMNETYLHQLYEHFHDQVDIIETYIQKGMDKD